MNEKNYLDVEVSYFESCWSTAPKPINLFEWLNDDQLKEEVIKLRAIQDEEEQKKMKKNFPAVTVSGLFHERNKKGLIKHSGLIAVDIDYKDNTHLKNYDQLQNELKKIPYIAYCAESIRGTGCYVIIPLLYPHKHEEHFEALKMNFKKISINIDDSCKDVSRLRLYSWDPDAYWNFNSTPYPYIIEGPKLVRKSSEITFKKASYKRASDETFLEVEKLIARITEAKIDITGNYSDWMKIGFALASEFGEDGRKYFHEISKVYYAYSSIQADAQYSNCLKYNNNKITIGTLFHIYTEVTAGISGVE